LDILIGERSVTPTMQRHNNWRNLQTGCFSGQGECTLTSQKKMHKVNWVADEQVRHGSMTMSKNAILTYTWPKFRSNYAVASSQVCPNSHNPRSYSLSRNTVENRRGQRTHHPARHLPNRIGVAGSRRPRPTLPLQPRHQRQSRDGPRLPPATAAIGP